MDGLQFVEEAVGALGVVAKLEPARDSQSSNGPEVAYLGECKMVRFGET